MHADLAYLMPTLAVLNQQMQCNVQSLTALGQACRDMAIKCDTSMDSAEKATTAVTTSLDQITQRLTALEDRFGLWETTYLKTILDHLPPPGREAFISPVATRSPSHPYAKPITPRSEPPRSPAVVPSPATPAEMIEAHRNMQDESATSPVEVNASLGEQETQQAQASTIQKLEQRSLRACAEKAVGPSKRKRHPAF